MYLAVRYSAISWELSEKGLFGQASFVLDPRSGEHIKSNIIISYQAQRRWLTKLAIQDLSDGKSAAMSDTGTTAVPPHHRRSSTIHNTRRAHATEDYHHGQGQNQGRSLQEHIPGKCQHAMALNHQGPATVLRLMMETDGRSTAEASDIHNPYATSSVDSSGPKLYVSESIIQMLFLLLQKQDVLDNIVSQAFQSTVTHEVTHYFVTSPLGLVMLVERLVQLKSTPF